jgi:dynein heavy chain
MTVSEVLDNWLKVQRDWMYLQPIFESDDIIKQLPAEAKKFATVDKNWRQTISSARKHPDVISFCDNEKLNERFREGVKHLDQVQKGLNQYLETKRDVFPRFYFLSNDDLLTILSESKDVVALQPHFKKVFEAVEKVTFGSASLIEKVISPEKESIDLSHAVDPKGHNVESWLLLLEGEMRNTIRDIMKAAIADYYDTPRIDWMQYWPSMHVLNGSQLHWTRQTEELFEQHGAGAPEKALERQRAELADSK